MKNLSKSIAISASLSGVALGASLYSTSAFAENSQIEKNVSNKSQSVEVGKTYYVTASSLTARGLDKKALGYFYQSDRVKVLENGSDLPGEFVLVQPVSSSSVDKNRTYLVSYKYLSVNKKLKKDVATKYFVIQNIATEKLRVYEKNCEGSVCNHKMIMETDMVVGENDSEVRTRTHVGSYRITRWAKFYEDHKRRYPAWYKDGYPSVPSAKRSATSWFDSKRMPLVNGKRKGSMRGAFGWYTALVGPNHSAQWTHGTIGWGKNKKEFINMTKGFWANVFADPRSHGCSRLDNESISFLRDLLPVGTPFVKVYAKEALLDVDRSNYPHKTDEWDYILTNERTSKALSIAAHKVLDRNVPQSRWLEEGTYRYDTFPNLVYYKSPKELGFRGEKAANSGNVYKVDEKFMQGKFFVDAGILMDYKHPVNPRKSGKGRKIIVGGVSGEIAPDYMLASSSELDLSLMSDLDPEVPKRSSSHGNVNDPLEWGDH